MKKLQSPILIIFGIALAILIISLLEEFYSGKISYCIDLNKSYHNLREIFSLILSSISKYWFAITFAPIVENIVFIGFLYTLFYWVKNNKFRIAITSVSIFIISILAHKLVDGETSFYHGFSFVLYYVIYIIYYKKYGFWKAILLSSAAHALSNFMKLFAFTIINFNSCF
jgi:hypothetical protein